MALLTSCWFIIESFVIPDGLVKWFYLSFYIDPFFLLFCQFFLWLKLLKKWFLILVFSPLKTIFLLALSFLRYCKDSLMHVFSFTVRVQNVDDEVTKESENHEVFYKFDHTEELQACHQILNSYSSISNIAPILGQIKVIEIKEDGLEKDKNCQDDTATLQEDEEMQQQPSFSPDKSKNECISFSFSSNSFKEDANLNDALPIHGPNSPANDQHVNQNLSSPANDQQMIHIAYSSPVRRFSSPVVKQKKVVDAYYKTYTERMEWFDFLNHDRTCGISAIVNNQIPSSLESIETACFSPQYFSPSKVAKRRLVRSLVCDFELVYVAQSCLSWEAIQHQYKRVKTLAASGSQNGQFHGNIAGEFQKFRVLLERFLEDEMCGEGKRALNYVTGRIALKSLLQVPGISVFVEEKEEEMEGEIGSSVEEVLRAIESCIQAFWAFVKTDTNKSWRKLIRSSLWASPALEDPRDLELLAHLTTTLRKKEVNLKDLKGKARCWFRRGANSVEESQRKEMALAMVDVKLVSMVLRLSTLSSSQLKWCQEKLQNIEFRQGKIFRTCTTPFFPTS